MKKMMFIAAIAFCAVSCGNKAANTEAAAEEAAVVEEVVVADTCAAPADSVVEVVDTVEVVAE